MTKELISLIIPLHNESQGIEAFYSQLIPVVNGLLESYNYEIIFIDDGSRDDTLQKITGLAHENKRIRIICLSRNFGKEIALTAGIKHAKGDALIMLDGDGQHPPKYIPTFIEHWKNYAEVVIGIRKSNKKEGWKKKFGSIAFYALFNRISGIKMIPGSTDYRLIDRVVADEFVKIKHHNRIARGLIDWLGFKRSYIEFNADARIAGPASYSLRKLFALASNTFISLSFFPLRIFLGLGVIISSLSLIGGLFILIEQHLMGDPLNLDFSGTASLAVLILFVTGIMLTCQGIISIYIAHMFYDVGNRPLYSISKQRSIGI